jgi:hypothetical protein
MLTLRPAVDDFISQLSYRLNRPTLGFVRFLHVPSGVLDNVQNHLEAFLQLRMFF